MHFSNTFLKLSFVLLSILNVVLAQSDATVTGIVTAQQPTSTPSTTAPSCATKCIQDAIDAQSCGETDTRCLCQNTSAIQSAASACLASSACTESEKAAAIALYPQTCSILGYSTKSSAATGTSVLFATGSAPSKAPHGTASSLVLTATGNPETGESGTDTSSRHPLTVPAVLGVTVGSVVIGVGIVAVVVWTCFRRRQQERRRPRLDLDTEFNASATRPKRSPSVRGSFMVQPSPIEKDPTNEFGDPLSRSSTIVAKPPTAVVALDKPLPEVRVSVCGEEDESFETFQERERLRIKKGRKSADNAGEHVRTSQSTLSMILESLTNINKTEEYDASNRI